MISDIAKALIEFLRLAPRYLIAVGIFAGFLLFASDSLLQRLGLIAFTQQNRPYLGLALVGTIALFVVSLAADLIGLVRTWRRRRRARANITARLGHLTEGEKQILRYYFAKNTRANSLRVDDGVVQELVAEGIIYRSANLGDMIDGFAHNISDLAWDYIHLNPHLLDGTTNTYRTDKQPSLW